MVKRKYKLLFIYLIVLSFLLPLTAALSGNYEPRSGLNNTAALSSSVSESFPQSQKNDFFTLGSPTGIFAANDGKVYAADKKMGVIIYGADGAVEKIFKRENCEYKNVFVSGRFIITLENGSLAFFDTDGQTRPQTGLVASDPDGLAGLAFADITMDGDTVWAVAGSLLYKIKIIAGAGTVSLVKEAVYDTGLANITSAAVAGAEILLAADYGFSGKALYLYDLVNAPSARSFPYKINDVAVFEKGGSLFAAVACSSNSLRVLTMPGRDTVAEYTPSSPDLSKGGIKAASYLYARGNELYVCDGDSRAAAIFGLPGLTFDKVLFASNGNGPGRLDSPQGLCVWDDKLYIADTENHRIQIWDKSGGTEIIGSGAGNLLFNPTAVAVDALGRVFAVDAGMRVIRYGADYNYISHAEPAGAYITGIAAAADGRIYISDGANKKILAADAGDEAFIFEVCRDLLDAPLSVCASLNFNRIYVLSKKGISWFDGGGSGSLAAQNIAAFALDCDNNIAALRRDPVSETIDTVKYVYDSSTGSYDAAAAAPFPLVYEFAAHDMRNMAFSPLSGDIYLTDTAQSRVYSLTADETGAAPFADAERPKYESGDPLPNKDGYRAAPLESQTPLYAVPLASKADTILPRGTSVAVLKRNLDGNGYYSFVYLPSVNKAGYVLKSLLGDDYADDTPLFPEGRIFNDGTPVYKFPSRLAPRILSGENELSLPKEKKVRLVPYSKAADAGPDKWYCIELDGGGIGFVSALNVANYKYQPTKTVLITNADIVKSAARGGAYMYEKIGNDYVLMEIPVILKDGCRVKVAGSFNANAKYTEVIFQDEEFGLIQGYVLTEYVKYDTTTNLQFIMLGLLVVLAAAATVAVYVFRRKKSRVGR